MSLLDIIAKVSLRISKPGKSLVSFFYVKGRISTQTTYDVEQLLSLVPKKSKKLALVINSGGGELSQALLISEKLKKKAKQLNIQFITFGQQFALNSGFFLLTQGNKVYADKTTCIGGLQVGQSKQNLGIFSQYINTVVYSQENSYFGELRKDAPFSQTKSAEMKEVFQLFSQQMKNRILSARKSTLSNPEIDLKNFYFGEQAQKLGIIDGVGRIHQTIPKLVSDSYLQLIEMGKMQNFLKNFKKIDARN